MSTTLNSIKSELSRAHTPARVRCTVVILLLLVNLKRIFMLSAEHEIHNTNQGLVEGGGHPGIPPVKFAKYYTNI
jgi:hypothetical protein